MALQETKTHLKGKLLYQLVREKYYTRQRFSQQTGISSSTLRTAINGGAIKNSTAQRIALALDTQVSELRCPEGHIDAPAPYSHADAVKIIQARPVAVEPAHNTPRSYTLGLTPRQPAPAHEEEPTKTETYTVSIELELSAASPQQLSRDIIAGLIPDGCQLRKLTVERKDGGAQSPAAPTIKEREAA